MKNELKSMSLFSAETLDSIAMAEVFGGDTYTYCAGGNCVQQCSCTNTKCPVVPVNSGIACGSTSKFLGCSSHSDLYQVDPPITITTHQAYSELAPADTEYKLA